MGVNGVSNVGEDIPTARSEDVEVSDIASDIEAANAARGRKRTKAAERSREAEITEPIYLGDLSSISLVFRNELQRLPPCPPTLPRRYELRFHAHCRVDGCSDENTVQRVAWTAARNAGRLR